MSGEAEATHARWPQRWLATQPLLVSAFLNAAIIGLVYSLFTPGFQTNDDVGVMLAAAGVSTVVEPTPMLVISHIGIGYLLSALYSIADGVPWYGLYLVGAFFLAHTAIFYAALRRRPSLVTVLLYLLQHLFLGTQLLISLQFTTAAAVVSIAGFVLLVYVPLREEAANGAPRRPARSWLPMVCGVALVGFGSMIRWQAALMGAALVAPMLVLVGLGRRREVLRRVALFAGGLAAALVVYGLDVWGYSRDAAWREFHASIPYMVKVADGKYLGFLAAQERSEVLAELGWSQNDLQMVSRFFFLDPEVWDLERLRTVFDRLPAVKRVPLDRSAMIVAVILRSPMAQLALLLCGLALAGASWKWRDLASYGTAVASAAAGIVILTYLFKAPPFRVWWPIAFFVVLPPMLTQIAWSRRRTARGIVAVVFLLVLAGRVVSTVEGYERTSRNSRARSLRVHTVLEKIAPEPDQLYVIWGGFPWEGVGPFEDLEHLRDFKSFGLDSFQRSPDSAKVLAAWGIEDLMIEMVGRDDVFLVTAWPDVAPSLYVRFVAEHHATAVRLEPVHRLRGIRVFRALPGDSNS